MSGGDGAWSQTSEDLNAWKGTLGTKGSELGDPVNTGNHLVWISLPLVEEKQKNMCTNWVL